jgi:type IV pilus biogenesis protein PilP
MLVGVSNIAMAQNAPGSIVERPNQTSGRNNVDVNQTQLTDNPCPEPKRALSSTPDDMAKIQEDITRFTLCVQRAQLLERLNELAQSNIETIDTALNLTVSNQPPVTDGNATPGIMPSVPMPQLPESVTRLLEDSDASDSPGTIGSGVSSMEQPPKRPSPWRVRDIQGAGGSISARLINNDGMMFKVKQGDNLPEDGGKVQSLSNTMVIIARDGDTEILKWVE